MTLSRPRASMPDQRKLMNSFAVMNVLGHRRGVYRGRAGAAAPDAHALTAARADDPGQPADATRCLRLPTRPDRWRPVRQGGQPEARAAQADRLMLGDVDRHSRFDR